MRTQKAAPHSSTVREVNMRQKRTTTIIFVAALVLSLLTNAVLLVRTSILKSEYSWLRGTYEADIVGLYQSNGLWIAYKEYLEGKPKEYILNSDPPSMGIAVENFYSHEPRETWNTNMISRALRVFYINKSQKPEPERIWHTKLKNRWLEAFVKEHNATIYRLIEENPNQPLQ